MMATTLKRGDEQDSPREADLIPGVDLLSPEEAHALFDRRVRVVMGISGDEFLRRWDLGEFRPVPDTPEGRGLGELVMMMSFARRTTS